MSDNPDFSSLLQLMKEKNVDVSSLISILNSRMSQNADSSSPNNDDALRSFIDQLSKNSSHNDSSTSIDNSQIPDMETIMKVMSFAEKFHSSGNSASTNLLYALKPFLRDSKKNKIDQYVNFIKISSLLNEMNQSGGDHL